MKAPWLISQRPDPGARHRLFCFPFAGGSASVYHAWPRLAPRHLHVCGVEYPGRGARLREEPHLALPPLVQGLADLLEPMLTRPYAFFGHSMGGLVAFELVRTLRERGARLPDHLFISATLAPGRRSGRRSLAGATDQEVLEELRDLGGTPPELLADAELMALTARTLRADYTALGTYEYRDGDPLQVPFTVFGGWADPIASPSDLRGWRTHSAVGCRFRFFPGDHFYLTGAAPDILRLVGQTVDDEPAGVPVATG